MGVELPNFFALTLHGCPNHQNPHTNGVATDKLEA
jgi:hypothetical protein